MQRVSAAMAARRFRAGVFLAACLPWLCGEASLDAAEAWPADAWLAERVAALRPPEGLGTRLPKPPPPVGRLFRQVEVFPSAVAPQAPLAQARLAELLDRNRGVLSAALGPTRWRIGVAFDAAFQRRYFVLSRPGEVLLRRLLPGEKLRKGIMLEPEKGQLHRLDLDVSLRHPVRGSVLRVDPMPGVRGSSTRFLTGDIIEAAKAAAFRFTSEGLELWLFYLTDVDPKTERFASSRTLLFVHEAGLRSSLWPVPEAAVPVGKPVAVKVEGRALTLVRGADGVLQIFNAVPAR
ncbi:MAG: hypothetical protein HY554_02910 [Elusimicrobia bacterium]|nr:hypothetical protein [Elusimicrobiota bacterium]